MTPDAKHIEKFIRSAIRQRQFLLKKGGNQKNPVQANSYINFLRIHLNANNYSPTQLASFFLRHFEKICFLLPSNRLKHAEELKNDFLNPKLEL